MENHKQNFNKIFETLTVEQAEELEQEIRDVYEVIDFYETAQATLKNYEAVQKILKNLKEYEEKNILPSGKHDYSSTVRLVLLEQIESSIKHAIKENG